MKEIHYKNISVNLDTREVKINDQALHLLDVNTRSFFYF